MMKAESVPTAKPQPPTISAFALKRRPRTGTAPQGGTDLPAGVLGCDDECGQDSDGDLAEGGALGDRVRGDELLILR